MLINKKEYRYAIMESINDPTELSDYIRSNCKKLKNKLVFENLTLAPIEKSLVNYKLLNKTEKDYLFRYHLNIYSEYSSSLNRKQRKWLASLI
jgi:hypothetical protein